MKLSFENLESNTSLHHSVLKEKSKTLLLGFGIDFCNGCNSCNMVLRLLQMLRNATFLIVGTKIESFFIYLC